MRRVRGQLGAVLVLSILTGCQERRHSSELGLGVQDPQALAAEIDAALAQNRLARADSLLAGSGPLEARDAALQYWTAQLALRRGEAEQALHALHLASHAAQPVGELALLELAMLQSARAEHAAAATSCQRLLDRHPDHPDAIALRVSSLAELGRFEEARAAVTALPDESRRWSLLGHVELLAGQPEAALEPLQRYHDAEPAHPLASYLYGWALLGVGRAGEAVAILRPLSEGEPPYKDSTKLLAQALEADGRVAEARALAAQAARRGVSRQVAELREQAYELAERGSLDAALSRLREAERLAPDDGPVLNDLGAVLTRRGEYAAAEAMFLRAESIAPSDAAIAANLAQLYLLMGDEVKAQERMRRYEELGGSQQNR
jgi:Flp pilus assembly protein TadD